MQKIAMALMLFLGTQPKILYIFRDVIKYQRSFTRDTSACVRFPIFLWD